MKLLQIHTFYIQYLKEFYKRYPNLQFRPFKMQIDALLADGFSASHLLSPYMNKIGYETMLIIANCYHSQFQWLRDNNLPISDAKDWIKSITMQQIETFTPDVLYLTDPITFDSGFLKMLNWKPSLTVGWRGASIPEDTDWSLYDVILSNSTFCLQKALSRKARHTEWFFPGMPEFLADLVKNEEKEFDVIFIGSWTSEHGRRNGLICDIALDALESDSSYCPHFFLHATDELPDILSSFLHPPIWGLDMYRTLRKAKIVFNAEIDGYEGETGNMRFFETAAMGSFLLTEYHENINDYFEPGVEIETFKDKTELIDKINYYLKHSDKREKIARKGYERHLKNHSMDKRILVFDDIIRRHLSEKPVRQASGADSADYHHINTGIKTIADRNDCTSSPVNTDCSLSYEDMPIDKLERARQLIMTDHIQDAFALLNQIKASRVPLRYTDLLRGICFIHMNRTIDAVQALREEIRLFPESKEANDFLADILKQHPEDYDGAANDPEFHQLYKAIYPYSMLSITRLYNLYLLAKSVCARNIPGHFVECGVAAGGSSALLAYVIKRYSKIPRLLYAFDSFSGMPSPSDKDLHQGKSAESIGWGTGTCAASEASVLEICSKLNVSDLVITVKGNFNDTLPQAAKEIEMISLLHLDGDWYESTKAILDNLYERVNDSGVFQVDDYGHWEGCKRALHDFEEERKIILSINQIDGSGIWFSKPKDILLQESVSHDQEVNFSHHGLSSSWTNDTRQLLISSGAFDRMKIVESEQVRPLMLFCETTNVCNSSCIFCPYSIQKRPKGVMTDELFQSVIQQYNKIGGGLISLTPMVGDILLDSKLASRMDTLKEFRETITPSVTTNLFALGRWSDETVVQMLNTFKMLHVSCYGITREENIAITNKDFLPVFCEQMRRLIKLRKDSDSPCDISMGFRLLFNYSADQLLDFQVRAFGETVKITGASATYNNWGNSMKGMLPGQAGFAPLQYNNSSCLFLIMALMVYWDGRVSACACCDYDATDELNLGRFDGNNLIDLYNSAKNMAIWQIHQHSSLPYYCKYCTFFAPLFNLNKDHPLLNDAYKIIGG